MTTGIAGAVSALSGFRAGGTVINETFFPRPFAKSRTVSSFADGLFGAEDDMPPGLGSAIETELSRSDLQPDDDTKERRRAEFFASLAVRVIAPRTLRRAGYESLATECENQRDFRPGGAAANAQHTIGKQYATISRHMAALA